MNRVRAREVARLLRPAYLPLAILLITALAVGAGPALPASLSGLTVFGPYAVLGIGVAISLWFNRGRGFIALASLLAGYAAYSLTRDFQTNGFVPSSGFAARAVFTGVAILVPLNVLVAALLAERGVSHHHNYRWVLVALAEIVLVGWVAAAGGAVSGTYWHEVLGHWLLNSPPMPVAGRIIFALAFAAICLRAHNEGDALELRPMDAGLAGALLAFLVACEWGGVAAPRVFGAFMSAAGVILLVSLLQESHRMAFNDTLTGLPGRRALEERLSGLGPVFTIAMVDVDHFKRFNDTHGHDTGDQVLKLVAARLAECGGGGQAYRYGGEEFCVVFPHRPLAAALPHLEALRQTIADYRMAVRSASRPKDPEAGTQLRTPKSGHAEQTLSVTVSIGVAERDGVLTEPLPVLKASDKALYRAKQAGRNRVCS
jgi:diguanylate cyclase (GGDEF)-like protein